MEIRKGGAEDAPTILALLDGFTSAEPFKVGEWPGMLLTERLKAA